MNLKCPFCQSEQIVFLQSTVPQVNPMSSLASPATLAALGASVAKTFNFPPLVGGVAGTVLGGLVNALIESTVPQQTNLCCCQHCYQRFPIHLLQPS